MIRVTESDGSEWVDAETFDDILAALKAILAVYQNYNATRADDEAALADVRGGRV